VRSGFYGETTVPGEIDNPQRNGGGNFVVESAEMKTAALRPLWGNYGEAL